ncbi:MAG: FAD-dependent oxidoreductase [Dehalococcoidia bacterium]
MEEPRIGVYICHCGSNIAGTVNCEDVSAFAQDLPGVTIARDYKYMCSDPGQNLIKEDIKNLNVNRVVVASCSPRMHEPTYRRCIQEAGLNPYLFEMANIREHCSWVHPNEPEKATEKAKALVRGAVQKVYYHEPLETREVPVNPSVLIMGGGIAGIQAALEIASSENKVYLVEREPSIGGHMAQLDKTFPTLDCSACILTPKMSLVGAHPNIELLTYSEVEEVAGYVGNFEVKVREKARFVDEEKCTGCGECTRACPVEIPSKFELGMTNTKAIATSFAQAVPNVASIYKREGGAWPPCRFTCPAGVNAQGYIALISQGNFKEAAEVVRKTMPFPGILGRVCTHPCESECERAKLDEPMAIRALKRSAADYERKVGREKASPVEITKKGKIAVVGSGPAGLACAYDLIREGYPVTVFEAMPEAGGMLRYGIPEYRLPKDVLDSEISYIEELGVEIKTNNPINDIGQLFNEGYKAIFMSNGAWTSQKMRIEGEDANGVLHALDFLKRVNSGDQTQIGKKVAVVGGGNAAIDAARVAWRLGAEEVSIVYRRSREEMPAEKSEIEETEREGINIQFLAAPNKVLSEGNKVSGIECTRMELGEPDASGRRRPVPVKGSEFTLDVDNVIIAIGQGVDKEALPEELEYTQWNTLSVDEITLETNIDGVFAGGDVVSGPASVIDAVAAGKEAATSIDRYIRDVDMKEGRPEERRKVSDVPKEGVASASRSSMSTIEVDKRVRSFAEVEQGFDENTAIEEAKRCLNCAGCADCRECEKVCEAGAINHSMQDEILNLEVGNIIVTTGFQAFDPTPIYQYGYHRLDNVVTGLEFERLISASGPTEGHIALKNGEEPDSVAIIHCVGSRDAKYHEYCSRVCCMYSMKYAHLLREHVPNARIYEFYIDLRCFGKGYEEFYNRMLKEDITFIRGRPGEITQEDGKLVVHAEDTLASIMRDIPVDMAILSIGLEPQEDADEVSKLLKMSRSADGFFMESHPKLEPVSTPTKGVFIAGCCQGPKDIPDTVAQASGAAAEALAMISRGKVEVEAATSVVDEDLCSGCKTCVSLCPYGAISFDEEKKVAVINEVLCEGCGLCAATCPSGAIKARHFTTQEIMAQIEGILV